MSRSSAGVRTLMCLTIVLAGGCGPGVVVKGEPDRNSENLFQFSRAYDQAHGKLGHPPKSLDELKPFLKEFGDPARLSVSPQDQQPYVVCWGVDARNASDPTLVIAYEKLGANGFRYVMTATGVEKMSDEEFARAKFPPGYPRK